MMLGSRFVQRQLRTSTTGLAVQGINIGALRKIQLPLPPPAEQQRIESSDLGWAAAEERVTFQQAALEGLRVAMGIAFGDDS
jgi:hypothetical protein